MARNAGSEARLPCLASLPRPLPHTHTHTHTHTRGTDPALYVRIPSELLNHDLSDAASSISASERNVQEEKAVGSEHDSAAQQPRTAESGSFDVECVLLLSHVFSYYGMWFLTIVYRTCSLTIECVLLLVVFDAWAVMQSSNASRM